MINKKTLTVAIVESVSRFYASINKEILTAATIVSVSIWLFNIVFVWKMYEAIGFFQSATILLFARIAYIYFVVLYAHWLDEIRLKIKTYFLDLIEKARK